MTGRPPRRSVTPSGRSRTVRFVLRGGFSAALLVGLGLIVDPGEIATRFAKLDARWVLAALALSVGQVALSAWRWRFTATRLGIALPFGTAVREYYLATFLNQVLPGGVLGDVSRAWRHASVAPTRTSIHAVVLERLSGQAIMLGVAACSLAWLVASVWGVALAFGLVIALLWAVRRRFADAPTATDPTATHRTGSPDSGGEALHADTRRALFTDGAFAIQLLTSTLVVASYLMVYLMAARALGVSTPMSRLLPLLAPVLVTMLLPVTIAGWGLREGAAAWLWSAVGLTAADGIAISVAYGVLVLVSALPGALVLLLTPAAPGNPARTAHRAPVADAAPGDDVPGRASRSPGA